MITTKRALALLTAALATVLAIVFAGNSARTAAGAKVPAAAHATPSAAEFAANLVGAANQSAQESGNPARIRNAHCVQASPGHYMCAYTAAEGGTSTCHLMQGRWTPGRASAITVTLAGRTAKCATLREAIRTLR